MFDLVNNNKKTFLARQKDKGDVAEKYTKKDDADKVGGKVLFALDVLKDAGLQGIRVGGESQV